MFEFFVELFLDLGELLWRERVEINCERVVRSVGGVAAGSGRGGAYLFLVGQTWWFLDSTLKFSSQVQLSVCRYGSDVQEGEVRFGGVLVKWKKPRCMDEVGTCWMVGL